MFEWIDLLQDTWSSWQQGFLPDLGVWSYILLALLVATEGPLSTLIGAAGAAAGILDIRLVFLATVAGNIGGDIVWYYLGYAGKMNTLHRYGRWVGVRPRHLDRLERGMHKHAVKLILFAKVAYGLIVPTLVAAGLARVPLRRWLPVVLVAETVWSLILVAVGYRAAGALAQLEQGFRFVGLGLLTLFVLVIFWMVRSKLKRGQDEDVPALTVLSATVVDEDMQVAKRPTVQPAHSSHSIPLVGIEEAALFENAG